MPTPVNTARQCLTEEAAQALDEAVSVAKRRGHGQTTSLHAVSALLSPPSSILRDACALARNSAYPARLQFKALDLCLSVSLDRVPSAAASSDQEPPVSNSLMAAIKRSQANQRRQPENFHFYSQFAQQQQQQQLCSNSNSIASSSSSPSSISCTIKVELRNLILSILDDPVVSRVFGEAGFRSSEIKLAIIRPLPQINMKRRPLFLCNFPQSNQPDRVAGSGFSPVMQRSFSFPFPGFYAAGDDNWRRIGEVLVREKGRNPLLVGAGAYDTLGGFCEAVEKKRESFLPVELLGLKVMNIESDLIKFLNDISSDREHVESRFEDLDRAVEKQSEGVGLMVCVGDLKVFVDNCNDGGGGGDDIGSEGRSCSDAGSYIVERLTKLMNRYGRKVWLIGAAASDDIYSKFISKFPRVEQGWNLQVFPITSRGHAVSEPFPRSR